MFLRKISFIKNKITSAVIINYTSFLCEAFILHKVNRYDIHGKRIFETSDKFYFEDNGIRNAIVGETREGDIEKVIESVIYEHLVRLGYQVYVGQLQVGEIDFVCTKPTGQRVRQRHHTFAPAHVPARRAAGIRSPSKCFRIAKEEGLSPFSFAIRSFYHAMNSIYICPSFYLNTNTFYHGVKT